MDNTLPEYALLLIHKIATQEGFSDSYQLIHERGSNEGDGEMANIIRTHIKGYKNNNSDELSLIIKTPIEEPDPQETYLTMLLFEREILTYNRFLPAIVRFQQEKGLSNDNAFYSFPRCYGTHFDISKNEFCIVLEDLNVRRFALRNDAQLNDIRHVQIVLQEMAKFHGLSFALCDQKPEIFEPFRQLEALKMQEFKMEIKVAFKNMAMDRAIRTLDPLCDREAVAQMTVLRDHYLEHLGDCLSKEQPKAVMNHGDMWNNNIMYSNKNGDEPSEIALIDWQYLQIGSPVLDLVFYLFVSIEKQLRDVHYGDLINSCYYQTLAKTISLAGTEAERVFSFCDLQHHLKKYGKFALLRAPIRFYSMSTTAPDSYNTIMRDIIKDVLRIL